MWWGLGGGAGWLGGMAMGRSIRGRLLAGVSGSFVGVGGPGGGVWEEIKESTAERALRRL